MNHSFNRRSFLAASAGLVFLHGGASWAQERGKSSVGHLELEEVEWDLDGRLGVFAFNSANGLELSYRAGERFPVCSTFKILAVSAVLQKSGQIAGLLERVIRYEKSDLVPYSPITEKHVSEGMTVAELCAAALQYSDNTAGNLLMRIVGGPEAVTAFARSIGDREFRLERWETALNSALPNDPRDTSSPRAMGHSLHRLVLGDALKAEHRERLRGWLLGNTTGAARIKAGIPVDWAIGDKTGAGDYGTANDVAVLWPPNREPVILAIYTTRRQKDAAARNDVIVAATRIVVDWVG